MAIRLWPKDFAKKEHITAGEKSLLRNASRNLKDGHFAVDIDPVKMSSPLLKMGLYLSPTEGLVTFSLFQGEINAQLIEAYIMHTLKIKADDLPRYVDEGWEKSKEYNNPKFVGITREKSIQEQFENKIWLLFASMGFTTMNADSEFYVSYDFHDE